MMDFFYAQFLNFIDIIQFYISSSVFFEAIAEKDPDVSGVSSSSFKYTRTN
ncbi:hypothetical protein JBL43_09380 [Aureibaculum sp. A20]|uniref:Uncharacterized protein n=1 Tax=Aureibaculum flavum TaxID=2795986 RepID=A0ABS0WR36_9FLAO|nr:hypothetical protein [Aureibaculum flavum]MBJ2174448.1 hypothetical protein [Aureibaculum flavum]